VHPGGPFWSNKDLGAWGIPKGLFEPSRRRGGSLRGVANSRRETGVAIDGQFRALTSRRLKSGSFSTSSRSRRRSGRRRDSQQPDLDGNGPRVREAAVGSPKSIEGHGSTLDRGALAHPRQSTPDAVGARGAAESLSESRAYSQGGEARTPASRRGSTAAMTVGEAPRAVSRRRAGRGQPRQRRIAGGREGLVDWSNELVAHVVEHCVTQTSRRILRRETITGKKVRCTEHRSQ
jgi:hypothetical protein